MKRVLSKVVVNGLIAGASLFSFNSFAADTAGLPRPDAAKGALLYEQGDASRGVLACVACHGAGGNSALPVNPNLAGLPYEYLLKQLNEFQVKEGAKLPARMGPSGNPTPMTAIAQTLTPQDMKNLSLYLSMQTLKEPATAGHKELVERGRDIWRAGIPDRRVPACAACHSANGAGIPGRYPRLAGQFPNYIEEQLKLFRSNDRANSEVMHQIADRMSDRDIRAVSDYAAGLR